MTKSAPSDRHQDWIERRRAGETLRGIGEIYGVSFQAVNHAFERWAPDLIGTTRSASLLPRRYHSASVIRQCRRLWDRGLSYSQIATKLTAQGYPMTLGAVAGLADRQDFPPRRPVEQAVR